MRANKILSIIIISYLAISSTYGQPGTKKFYFCANINIIDKNTNLLFITKDSLKFISNKSKISLNIYEVIKESFIRIIPLKLENDYNKFSYTLKLSRNGYFQIRNKKCEYYDGKQTNWSSSILLKIKKDKKLMIIYFDFNNNNTNNCENDTNLGNFTVNFKEGIYEVTNPEKPELIEKKE